MLSAGTEVGGYRVIRKIGEGGMATVYEAEQVSLGRLVALKVLTAEFADDAVFQQRFERERKALAELDHPHVVTVFEGGSSDHRHWLAMQLVKGTTLAEMAEAEALAPETVWELLTPIAAALGAAHEKGLIHRDVTPRNILVAENGTPLLADFGLAKKLGERTLTEPGGFLGTPQYVAPEQLRVDDAVVPASDVYSLTAVLFRCLCGRPPFQKATRAGFVFAHLSDPPPPPSSIDPSLPPALDAVIARGMAKDANERFETPSELIAAARGAFEGGRAEFAPSALRPRRVRVPPALRMRRWSPTAFGAAALLLFGLSFGAGALADGSPRGTEGVVRAGPLRVGVPEGWAVEKRALNDRLHLHLTDPVTLVARSGRAGEAATVGISLARGRTLLPLALRPFGERPRGEPISFGSLQGLRYGGLGPEPKRESWSAIVAPTSIGVVTIACRAKAGEGDPRRTCQALAGSLKLRDGVGYPVGPSAQLAILLRRQVGKLDREVRRLRRRLVRVQGSGAQGAAASALAKAFRRCATTLAATPASPQSAAHLAAIITAARWVRDAYKRMAAAARSGNSRAFHAEEGDVYLTESILYNRILYLRSLGYRVADPI